MTTLIWQTSLILLCAYFLGAWVACLLRRTLGADAEAELSYSEAVAAPVQAAAVPRTMTAPARRPDPKPIAIETIQRPAPHATADAAKKFEDALTNAPKVTPPAPPVTRNQTPPPSAVMPAQPASVPTRSAPPGTSPTPGVAPVSAAAVVETAKQPAVAFAPAAASLPTASSGAGPSSVSAPIAKAVADDLTRIGSIDAALHQKLKKLGVMRYQDIADWQTADVNRISAALGYMGRVEQENWIEQAQILAKGGETSFARRVDSGLVQSASSPTENEGLSRRIVAAPPVVANVAATISKPEVATLAAFGQPMVKAVQSSSVPLAATPGMSAAAASAAAAGLGAAAASMSRDNLQRISGINAEVEKLLNVQGITRYSQMASWTPADALKIDRMFGYEGRVAKESWIEQASLLARGGDTAFSRQFDQRTTTAPSPPADVPRAVRVADPLKEPARTVSARPSDMSTLRSVRSEAYSPPAPRGGAADDLKRIRGVGVLIEKKLNSMGITTYAQVANWSSSDIDRVSNVLDFKGRIERENWVEQARILSAGGQTEFSRRVDRGDVGH